jgi:histidinol-phosphatase
VSTVEERRAWVDLGLAIADEADAIALRHFRRDLEITAKPDRTFVTQADKAIEAMIRERIAASYPDHGLVGEEYGVSAGGARIRWYIDPIDGTHNFIRGVPLFGMLLAVEEDGELQAGVISAPALGERWYAWRGGGAWAVRGASEEGPRALRVSGVSKVDDAQLLYGSGRDIRQSGRVPGFDALLEDVWRERGFGDFWGYALVAEGAAEGMVEVDLSTWDAAAPAIIVEEAGGRWSDLDGQQRIDTRSFLVSNGVLHEELLRRLRTDTTENPA